VQFQLPLLYFVHDLRFELLGHVAHLGSKVLFCFNDSSVDDLQEATTHESIHGAPMWRVDGSWHRHAIDLLVMLGKFFSDSSVNHGIKLWKKFFPQSFVVVFEYRR